MTEKNDAGIIFYFDMFQKIDWVTTGENERFKRNEGYHFVRKAKVRPGSNLSDLMEYFNNKESCKYSFSHSNCHHYALDVWNKIGKFI